MSLVRRRVIGPSFPFLATRVSTVIVPSGYIGPGDVVSGAWAYAGLQSYTAAYCASGTASCLDLVDGTLAPYSGNPIRFLTSGKMDSAAATTAIAAGFQYVHKLYDSSGNGRDFTPSSNHPVLSMTDGPSGTQPGINFTLGGVGLNTTATLTTAQPFTIVFLAKVTPATSTAGAGVTNVNIVMQYVNDATPGWLMTTGGGDVRASADSTSFHFVQGLFNGASSLLQIDSGTASTGTTGTTGLSADSIYWGGAPGFGYFDGKMCELGIWASNTHTGTNWNDLSSNTHGAGRWNF